MRARAVLTGYEQGAGRAGRRARYLAVYGVRWGVATLAAAAAPLLVTQVIGSFGPPALWGASAGLYFLMATVEPWLMRVVTVRRGVVPASAVAALQ